MVSKDIFPFYRLILCLIDYILCYTEASQFRRSDLLFLSMSVPLRLCLRHAPTTDKVYDVQTGQARQKRKDCQTSPRQGKMILKIVCQLL